MTTSRSEPYSSFGDIKKLSLRLKILLVEDHPTVQTVHKIMLEMADCRVDIAVSGEQALAMHQEGVYDVILLDIGLPDISGLLVCETIRGKEKQDKRTPIVALTAFSHEDIKQQCLAAGADEVAIKPLSFDELQTLLSRWVAAPQGDGVV